MVSRTRVHMHEICRFGNDCNASKPASKQVSKQASIISNLVMTHHDSSYKIPLIFAVGAFHCMTLYGSLYDSFAVLPRARAQLLIQFSSAYS